MVVALPLYFYYTAKSGWEDFRRHLSGAWWLIAYLPTIALVSYSGSTTFGGHNYIPYGYDLAVVAVIGIVFYFWGISAGWRTPMVEAARFNHDEMHGDEPVVPPSADEAARASGQR